MNFWMSSRSRRIQSITLFSRTNLSKQVTMQQRALSRNLVPIVTFAVVGTVLSALLTGGMLYIGTKATSTPIPALDSTIFGALISSIDPVATLSVLSSVGIRESEAMYVLVFGESLLNDGVAIVLFKTLLDHLDGQGGFASDDETALDLVATVAAKFLLLGSKRSGGGSSRRSASPRTMNVTSGRCLRRPAGCRQRQPTRGPPPPSPLACLQRLGPAATPWRIAASSFTRFA